MSAIESSQAQCKQKILQKQQHGHQHQVEQQQQHFQRQETKATMKTSENLSIASSSALVGENVLDIEDTNPQCPLTPKSSSSQGSADRRGVSHHVYSPVKVKEMLNTYGGAEDLEIFQNIPPALYHRELRDAKASTFIPTLEKPVTPPPDSTNDKTNANKEEPRSMGIMEATKKWFQSRRERQQREALERQVEEQRQILLHQSEKLKDEARRATFGDHYVDEEEIVRVRVEKGRVAEERGLDGNETFKSIMYSQKTSGGGGICSAFYYSDDEFYDVDGDDNDDGKGGSGADNHRAASYKSCEDGSIGSKENYSSAVLSFQSMDIGMDSTVSQSTCDNGANNKHHTKGSEEEKDDFLKISSPSDTFSGQGMSVKVEIFEPKSKSDKDAFVGEVRIEQERNNIPFLLKNDQMKSILTLGLPASIMFSKWKRLYSLQRDGDSFEGAFLRKVKGQSRTLLVIKTTRGDVMGGYAESPWESQGGSSGAVFYGSAQACLFSIRKDQFSSSEDDVGEVRVFKWTGANRYIQLCDVQGKILAFGGGGNSGEFGLRVEDDFRTGSTGSCETFGNEPLCEQVHFDILDVECWGFKTGF